MRDAQTPEYSCHVALMFLDEELDPAAISKALTLQPTQAWRTGDLGLAGTVRKWGGWKRSPPPREQLGSLARQLHYWCNLLDSRRPALAKIRRRIELCAFNCHVFTSGTASIIISPSLQNAVAGLALEVRLSVIVHGGSFEDGA